MGVDWDGLLIYGYDLGFPDEIIEYDNEPDWYDEEEDDLQEQIMDTLLSRVAGFTEKYSQDSRSGFWDRKREAEKSLEVGTFSYCSTYDRESTGLILGTKMYRASEGEVAEIYPETDLVVEPSWNDNLDRAIKALGLKPRNAKPAWLLATLMS